MTDSLIICYCGMITEHYLEDREDIHNADAKLDREREEAVKK